MNYLSGQVHRQNADKRLLGLEGRGELLLHEDRVSLWSNESILEIRIQRWWLHITAVNLVVLNWTLKVMEFMLPTFYHHFLKFSGSSRTLLCVTHMCVLRDESPGQGLPADLLGAEALWGQSLSPAWGLGTVPRHPIWGFEP